MVVRELTPSKLGVQLPLSGSTTKNNTFFIVFPESAKRIDYYQGHDLRVVALEVEREEGVQEHANELKKLQGCQIPAIVLMT